MINLPSHARVVIIGGGGHGLATAYYLAKEHGITNIAVLEKELISKYNADIKMMLEDYKSKFPSL